MRCERRTLRPIGRQVEALMYHQAIHAIRQGLAAQKYAKYNRLCLTLVRTNFFLDSSHAPQLQELTLLAHPQDSHGR